VYIIAHGLRVLTEDAAVQRPCRLCCIGL